jgi:hypothetical protein
MAAIDTFLTMVGDVAAGVAAVAAVTGARYARQTVREARAERLEAEQARLVRRLEWVGETIEHIDRLAEDDQRIRPVGDGWRRGRQLLAQGFVGLAERLPRTAELVQCADPFTARSIVMHAREEVGQQLRALAAEQVLRPDDRPGPDAGAGPAGSRQPGARPERHSGEHRTGRSWLRPRDQRHRSPAS